LLLAERRAQLAVRRRGDVGLGVRGGGHEDAPCGLVVAVLGCTRLGFLGCFRWDGIRLGRGTWVVQALSPLTIVASRCTWVSRISAKASRSASHNSGISSATCDT